MILRPGQTITNLNTLLVRLGLAHDDLLAGAATGDQEALVAWRQIKLETLNEAIAPLRQERLALLGQVVKASDLYRAAALDYLKELLPADPKPGEAQDTSQSDRGVVAPVATPVRSALLSAFAAANARAQRALGITSLYETLLPLVVSVITIATSLTGSILSFRYQAAAADRAGRLSLDMGKGTPCSDAEQKLAGERRQESNVTCLAWDFEAWRTSPAIEFRATATSDGTQILRATGVWLDRLQGEDRVIDGPDGPAAQIPFFLCSVQKNARLRFLVWLTSDGENDSVQVVAHARGAGETACSRP